MTGSKEFQSAHYLLVYKTARCFGLRIKLT